MTPAEIANGVHAGNKDAEIALYELFETGIAAMVRRALGSEAAEYLQDLSQDILLSTLRQLRAYPMRDPDRLAGLVRVITRARLAEHYGEQVEQRKCLSSDAQDAEGHSWGIHVVERGLNPEERAAAAQRRLLMRQVLQDLAERDRELLTRFYLEEQSMPEICEALGLTETQFRLTKNRAKVRFGAAGRKALRKPLPKAA